LDRDVRTVNVGMWAVSHKWDKRFAILMLGSLQDSIPNGLDRLTDVLNVMMHAGDADAV